MKSSKPRKRRTQTLAEKSEETKRYAWQELLGSYVLQVSQSEQTPRVDVNLSERDGQWEMVVEINDQRYFGWRKTLEEAYKATADLLFKHAKGVWLREDARVVMAPWAGSMEEV